MMPVLSSFLVIKQEKFYSKEVKKREISFLWETIFLIDKNILHVANRYRLCDRYPFFLKSPFFKVKPFYNILGKFLKIIVFLMLFQDTIT